MNNFLELVRQRVSVRDFSAREVEQEKLDSIFDAVRFAPSAANFQPWRFFVIRSEAGRQKLYPAYPRQWFATAPVYIVACYDQTTSWKRGFDNKDHGDIDVAIGVEHLCLAAAEQGLGTCWVCHFDPAVCSRQLELPENLVPVAIIPLGYPAGTPSATTPRKEREEIVTFVD